MMTLEELAKLERDWELAKEEGSKLRRMFADWHVSRLLKELRRLLEQENRLKP